LLQGSYTRAGMPCKLETDSRRVDKRLRFVIESLDSTNCEPSSILDVGVGYGAYFGPIQKRYKAHCYVGVDLLPDHLHMIKRGGGMSNSGDPNLFLATADALPFQDEIFDAVLLIEVLEHIVNDVAALKEISRVMKPEGLLTLTAPNKLFPFETHGFRIGSRVIGTKGFGFPLLPLFPEVLRVYVANARVYTPNHLESMLAQAGFHLEKMEFISPDLDHLIANLGSKKIATVANRVTEILDKSEKNSVFKYFMATITVCCSKKVTSG
jgi:ubiquinone/menaquinone biosynthesis C-methylase UbiE